MNQVWGIQGSDYDGCDGWSTWTCDGLLFTTKEKAQEYIKDRWGNSRYSRFKPILIEVQE